MTASSVYPDTAVSGPDMADTRDAPADELCRALNAAIPAADNPDATASTLSGPAGDAPGAQDGPGASGSPDLLAVVSPASVHGLNPLVGAAHPLLELGDLLRRAATPQPLEPLREQLAGMMREFVRRAAGTDAEILAAARYCLCTFLDEVIASTPWGGNGAWSSRSLLVTFHSEASGGERFFTILHRLSQNPQASIDALELLYIILALGLEGRYRVIPGGGAELSHLRERLRQLIRNTRGPVNSALSPHWRGETDRRRPARKLRVAWWVLAASVCCLGTAYTLCDARLRERAAPVRQALERVHVADPFAMPALAMRPPASPMPAPASPPAAVAPMATVTRELKQTLAPEIARHAVTLDATADRAILTLDSDGLFASGSSWVSPAYVPLIQRIGQALRGVKGHVIVIGHTDNVRPAPGAPGNDVLSLRRAGHVVDLLTDETGDRDRFEVQGRGDSEPLASNDTEAGRARNRRVVIIVLAPGAPR
jgi:type VI secretion system protein ImpK